MECEYCKQILKTAGVLKKHQNTAKYCLTKQNKTAPIEYSCSFCGTCFTLKSTLHSHLKICKANTNKRTYSNKFFSLTKHISMAISFPFT